jgi:aspartate racemase
MQTIGLMGGMSWSSTVSYYQIINSGIQQKLGGLHSAKIVLVSVDFAEIELLQRVGDWQQAADILISAAKSLQAAGADFFLICSNTMHRVADQVSQAVSIPLLHIADATANLLKTRQINKVALLGTKFTMQEGFYKNRLEDKFAISVLVPSEPEQEIVHRVIYQELYLGLMKAPSRQQYLTIVDNLRIRGAQGIILGCTEIGLLIDSSHTKTLLYDTSAIHAQAAVAAALQQ